MTVDTESFSIQQLHRDIYPRPHPPKVFGAFSCHTNWITKWVVFLITWWLSVDDFSWRTVLQWNLFLVSLLSNLYFLRELIWYWLGVCIIAFEIFLHAHLRNVLKYDYLVMKTKGTICLWKLLLLLNPLCNEETFFLHGILQIMAIFNFANALVWLLSLTWNVTIRNGFWIHSCELSIRPYLPSKAQKEPGNSSPVSVDHWSKIDLKWRLARTFSQGVTKTQTPLCYLIFAISLFNFDPENAP